MRNGAGTTSSITTTQAMNLISDWHTADHWTDIYRPVVLWNTSTLPDDATITGATISVAGNQKASVYSVASTFGITGITPATAGTIVTADYNKVKNERFADSDIAYASYSTAGTYVNNWTLNTLGLSNISKTGWTNVSFRQNFDIDNSSPVWADDKTNYFYFRTSEFGKPAILTVTYITPPVSSFIADNETPCSSDTVQFNDTSTNTPTAWDWRWWSNETTSSTLQNPTYQFPPGLYNVRLYASNAAGGDWENKTGFINSTDCTPPITSPIDASFTSNVTCGNIPFTVQFNDTSTGSPTTWNWSFGTGNYSGLQNPVFEYNTSGLFTINFSANNGNTDWMNRSGYIRAVPNWANCPPTPTPTPTWGPEIMPSTDNEIASPSWVDYMISFWWVWLLLVVGYILVKK
jgi:PKD repeat protein